MSLDPQLVLIAEHIGEVATRLETLETQARAAKVPVDAATSAVQEAARVLCKAKEAVALLEHHVLDSDLGKLSFNVETLQARLADFEEESTQRALQDYSERRALSQTQRTELAALRQQLSVAQEAIAAVETMRPRGSWKSDSQATARGDVFERLGSSYVALRPTKQPPSRGASDWMLLASRGGTVSGGSSWEAEIITADIALAASAAYDAQTAAAAAQSSADSAQTTADNNRAALTEEINDRAAADALKANKDGSNLEAASVALANLADDALAAIGGGLNPENFLGNIIALDDDLAAAASNSGKWYFVDGVDGTMTGANPPASDVADGGFIFSDGSTWNVRAPSPVVNPDGSITRAKLASEASSALLPENSVSAVYDRPDYAVAFTDSNGRLLAGLPFATDIPELIHLLRSNSMVVNPTTYADYDRDDVSLVFIDSNGRILYNAGTPANPTPPTGGDGGSTASEDFEWIPWWVAPGAQDAVTESVNVQDIIDLWDAVLSAQNTASGVTAWGVKSALGTSSDGAYTIYKYVFTPPTYDKTLILCANIHGNEKHAAYLLPRFFESMNADWEGNPALEYLRWRIRWVVVPSLNPWGFDNDQRRIYETADIPCSWSRSGTTVTVTVPTGGSFPSTNPNVSGTGYIGDLCDGKLDVWVTDSSDTGALPNSVYRVQTTPTAQTFTITGVDTGGTSGTLNFRVFVDPNRNFDCGNWSTYTSSTTFVDGDGGAYDNKGTKPFSLAESVIAKELLEAYPTAVALISYHNGPAFPYPVYYPPNADSSLWQRVIRRFEHLTTDAISAISTSLNPNLERYTVEVEARQAISPEWETINNLDASEAQAAYRWFINFAAAYARFTTSS